VSARMKRMRTTPRDLPGLAILVRDARVARGATVVDAAAAAGVSRSTWVRIENGLRIRADLLGRIEAYLGWAPSSVRRWLEAGGPVPGNEADTAPPRELTPREIIENLSISADRKRRLLAVFDVDEPRP
jgi:transcriptional regulator with XRE-family HTH domain